MYKLLDFMSNNNMKSNESNTTNTEMDKISKDIMELIKNHLSDHQCYLLELAMVDHIQRENTRNLTIDEENILKESKKNNNYDSDDGYYDNLYDDTYDSHDGYYDNWKDPNDGLYHDNWKDPND